MSFYLSPTSSILLKIYFPKKKELPLFQKKKKRIYKKPIQRFFFFWSNQNASDTHSIDYPYVFWDKNKDFFFLFGYFQENVLNGIEL